MMMNSAYWYPSLEYFLSPLESGVAGQINRVISHPTLPITITAHEDRHIRFYDNNTGEPSSISAVCCHICQILFLIVIFINGDRDNLALFLPDRSPPGPQSDGLWVRAKIVINI